MNKKRNLGFTLFELLVVISIIGIILGLGTVAFSTAQKRGRDARRVEDMQVLQKALEQYYALEGDYPNPVYSSGALTSGTTTIMQTFPVDPKNADPYLYTDHASGDATTYCYCATLEDTTAGNEADGDCTNWADDSAYYCVGALQ